MADNKNMQTPRTPPQQAGGGNTGAVSFFGPGSSNAEPNVGSFPGPPYPPRSEDKTDYRTVILTDENYVTWKWHMTMVLKTKNLYECVLGTNVSEVKERQAATLIGSSLNDGNMQKVINCQTAKEIWSTLEANFENKSSTERSMLMEKFTSYKISNVNNISKALSDIQAKAAKLKALGATVDEEFVVSIILKALPDCMKAWRSTWKMVNAKDPNLNSLISSIMAEVNEMKHPEDTAFVARDASRGNFRRRGQGRPDQRGTSGPRRVHRSGRNSRDRNAPAGSGSYSPRPQGEPRNKKNDLCNYCKKTGHWKRDCRKFQQDSKGKDEQKDSKPVAFMAVVDYQGTKDTEWIADTGSSFHMTPRLEWIEDYKEFWTPRPVSLGDDHIINALGSGKVITTVGEMLNVHYVPELGTSLFSITAFSRNNRCAICSENNIVLMENGKVLHTGLRRNGLYLLDFSVEQHGAAYVAAPIQEWHEKLGHCSSKLIQRMANDNIAEGLEIAEGEAQQCEQCIINKCTRTSHPSRTTPKTTKAGISLHFDTVGPMKYRSPAGSRFFVLCKDEASSYRMARFIASKSVVPDRVKSMIAKAEVATGNRVLQIVTDNGTEYVNDSLHSYLQERGICHILSEPYTPEQNGLVEREVRTVVESARTLLNSTNLPRALWCEATNTAIYVLNRTINSRNPRHTPFELWYGRKPDLSNIHKFGQEAIVRFRDYQKDKWGIKGSKLIFVGYSDNHNTYRFYDQETDQVFQSCDAIFLHNTRNVGLGQVNEEQERMYVNGTIAPEQLEQGENHHRESDEEYDASDTSEDSHQDSSRFFNTTNDSFATVVADKQDSSGTVVPDEQDSSATVVADEQNSSATVVADEQDSSATVIADEQEDYTDYAENRNKDTPIPPQRKNQTKPKRIYINPKNILDGRLRSQSRYHAKLATIEAESDPTSYKDAMNRSDRNEWEKAMYEEINSLMKNQVWELVDRPNKNVVTNKWVLKIKRKPNGDVERYKARLVARGFSQIPGVDYSETYAPVANTSAIRMLFAYAAKEKLEMAQFDVKTAFLYGSLDETVYMEQPEGFSSGKDKVCLLKRSLYGLKQSPRQWNKKFSEFLKEMNLTVSEHDECIFYRRNPLIIIAIYVDDGIIFAEERKHIDFITKQLKRRFEVHLLDTSTFLGFQVYRGTNKDITLHQTSYINTILKRFSMEDSRSVDAPVSLSKSSEDDSPLQDSEPYREAIGSLMYAAVTTRIDIAYAVGKASRKVSSPTNADWMAVKRIFRYLRGTESYGLTYRAGSSANLHVYCDADFAGDEETSRSTTGAVIMYAGAPIHWKSQRQSLITLSSTEAEFVSLCSTVKDTVWLRKLGHELGILEHKPALVHCDNQSAIRIATNQKSVHRTRHMSVQANYPREQIENGVIKIDHVKTDKQLADMLTKPTTIQKFVANRGKLMTLATKIFSVLMMIAVCTSVQCIQGLERTANTLWMETDNFVEIGLVSYDVDYTYLNPCKTILFSKRQDGRSLFDNHITGSDQEQLEKMSIKLYEECEATFRDAWESRVMELRRISRIKSQDNQGQRTLQKRNPLIGVIKYGIAIVTNFAITLTASSILNSNNDRIDKAEQQGELDRHRISNFESNFNTNRQITQGILESIERVANKTIRNTEELRQLQELLPTVAWQSADLHSKIITAADNLQTIINKYMEGQLAMREASQLWNTTEFNHIRSRDTILKDIKLTSNMTLNFKFMVRQRSIDTRVYRVQGFRHWANLTETPTLRQYRGPEFLIHNSSSGCTKGIDEPFEDGIQEDCPEQRKVDPRLDLWTETALEANEKIQDYDTIQVKKTPAYNYFYCYGHSIVVDGTKTSCPPYVFKLNYNISYTLGLENYVPSQIRLAFKPESSKVIDLLPTQVRGTENDETELLDALREMKVKNKNLELMVQQSVVVQRYGTTWWFSLSMVIIVTAVMTLYCTRSLREWLRAFILERRERVRANVRYNPVETVPAHIRLPTPTPVYSRYPDLKAPEGPVPRYFPDVETDDGHYKVPNESLRRNKTAPADVGSLEQSMGLPIYANEGTLQRRQSDVGVRSYESPV